MIPLDRFSHINQQDRELAKEWQGDKLGRIFINILLHSGNLGGFISMSELVPWREVWPSCYSFLSSRESTFCGYRH